VKQLPCLSKDQVRETRVLFGPAPILPSEAPELFEIFFEQLTNRLQPRDIMEVLLIWHFAVDTWRVNQAIRHGTVAIERRYEEGVRQKLLRARPEHEAKRQETGDHIRSHTPGDIAAIAALQVEALSVAADTAEICKRKDAERDLNIAFERSMIFQEQLERLIASATRRRDDALLQLELYRNGLGAQAQEASSQLIEGEVHDTDPTMIEAPSLAPNDDAGTGEDSHEKESEVTLNRSAGGVSIPVSDNAEEE
jgi:hypothetical protein